VAYSTEGTLPLGESTDAANDFGVEATLAVLGPRTLVATGYDACGAALATAMLVTVVGEVLELNGVLEKNNTGCDLC
jgi:hypothetical protein